MYKPLEDSELNKSNVNRLLADQEVINVLLLGGDERDGESVSRTDSMIFASVNPKSNQILMFSIPRDTYVEIPGYGMDKINHSYAFGQEELTIKTVENFLDVPIHFYFKINMEGFEDGVDAVGGVTVTNTFEFSYGGFEFPKGTLHLNGEEALEFTRMRDVDPNGDFGRTSRQREVIKAMIGKVVSFESFTRINEVLSVIEDNVKTNMQLSQMKELYLSYRGARKEIATEHIEGSGEIIDQVWYYVLTDEEVERIRGVVKEHIQEE
ncbi:transcriptional regulator LytR [Filobacillus milosensis]|uniref:Transcriptional regulator LytR n=2 Tax=Filobacillus milosensis TaxID=94137 RepID=A0A4Y8IHU5_9BACI|nr:transcriptional regulator LytR [Filobacillus milosensis]